MVILGIDFGDKRMGLAVCDKNEMMAVSIGTEFVRGAKHAAEIAARVAKERNAEQIVVGMPCRSDGFHGERCEKTDVFLGFLGELYEKEIVTFDERFTTTTAHDFLYATGMQTKKHSKCVDAVSAQIILESYLNDKKEKKSK